MNILNKNIKADICEIFLENNMNKLKAEILCVENLSIQYNNARENELS